MLSDLESHKQDVSLRMASKILHEAYVEHLVGLVENHDLDTGEPQALAADVIESAARSFHCARRTRVVRVRSKSTLTAVLLAPPFDRLDPS